MFKAGTRILLKLSGEALGRSATSGCSGIVPDTLKSICTQIQQLSQYRWAIVVGGGNFFRGMHQTWCHRSTADRIGMLATGMNGLALQEMFNHIGVSSRVLSCGVCSGLGETYDPYRARRLLEEKEVVICVGGTGAGHVTTDTASVLRACEMDSQIILKGSFVDGVFDQDPKHFEDAKFLPKLTYTEVLEKRLSVMDSTAFTLAQEFNKTIIVFSILQKNALVNLFQGTLKHSVISTG